MIWWFLLIWLTPIVLYTLVAWLILPKGSTISDLVSIFDNERPYPYIPPLIAIILPVIGLLALVISIIWFLKDCILEVLSNSNIRIK